MKITIKIDIYNTTLIVLINEPYKRLLKHFKKYGNENIPGDAMGLAGRICSRDNPHYYIWISSGSKPSQNISKYREQGYLDLKSPNDPITLLSTLSHEIVHTTQDILEDVRIYLKPETTEAYAYLTEFIFNRIIKQYLPKYLTRQTK